MHTTVIALLSALAVTSCRASDASSSNDAGACPALFGKPNEKTGLTSDQCVPSCTFDGGVFAPPDYDAAFIQSLVDGWTLATPYAPIATDPYASSPPPDD